MELQEAVERLRRDADGEPREGTYVLASAREDIRVVLRTLEEAQAEVAAVRGAVLEAGWRHAEVDCHGDPISLADDIDVGRLAYDFLKGAFDAADAKRKQLEAALQWVCGAARALLNNVTFARQDHTGYQGRHADLHRVVKLAEEALAPSALEPSLFRRRCILCFGRNGDDDIRLARFEEPVSGEDTSPVVVEGYMCEDCRIVHWAATEPAPECDPSCTYCAERREQAKESEQFRADVQRGKEILLEKPATALGWCRLGNHPARPDCVHNHPDRVTPAPTPTERVCRCKSDLPACPKYDETHYCCGHDRACHTEGQR